jgi:mono/diheme cytochrome c family protein
MRIVVLATFLIAIGCPAVADESQFVKGQALYGEFCSRCHGADGKRGEGFQTPIWGQQTQISKFQNAMGLFEYNEVMMPFDGPDKLNEDQKWDVLNYLLVNHGAIQRGQTLNRANAAQIQIR